MKRILPSFLLFALAFSVLGQAPAPNRPQAPTPSPVRRPNMPGRPNTAAPTPAAGGAARQQNQPVTQPGKSGGSQVVVPYDENENALNFQEASVDLVLMEYALRTHRTLLKAPNVPQVNITLRTTPDTPLTDEQYLLAIEKVLNMNGIALEPLGDQFLQVYPFSELTKTGKKIRYDEQEEGTEEDHGQFVEQMITLKYVDISEVQPIVTSLIRQGGQIQTFERTNSILLTDAADNVERIVKLLQYIDKPVVAREEPNIRQIKYAKAADIKSRLEEIVTQAQEEQNSTAKKATDMAQNRQSGSPGADRRPLPPGVSFRGRDRDRDDAPKQPTTETAASLIADAQKGILRGKVSIIADERTNILIILTRPENMVFFDKIIEVLDKQTAPEYLVEVVRLKHAVAEDMASLLNDLIGKQKASDKDADPGVRGSGDDGDKSAPAPLSRSRGAAAAATGDTRTRIGQLDSENISILADERTNALIMMASSSDMVSLRNIVEQMDIQLSQVVIETVIIAIDFTDTQETGMDWVQRAMLQGEGKNGPAMAFATAGGGGKGKALDTLGLTTTESLNTLSTGGATGWFTIFDWNMDLILKAVQSDSRSRIMESPRITTMDNKEAVLEATKRIYWKGDSTNYENYSTQNTKSEDVGIKLNVTPRINKTGYITLTIEQEIQNNNGYTTLSGSDYPNLTTRKMGADVAVQSGETVVLGGLAENTMSKTTSKVPILGSIPLLGWFFRSEVDVNTRTEIIVFLTPRVIDTPDQMEDDARNLKSALDTDGIWDPTWSGSRLADPLTKRRAREVLENGENTVAPARYPMTGALTGVNKPENLTEEPAATMIREEQESAAAERRVPFLHYSDVDAAKRVQEAHFYVEETTETLGPDAAAETSEPEEKASEDEAPAPAVPAETPEPDVPAEVQDPVPTSEEPAPAEETAAPEAPTPAETEESPAE